MSSQGFCREQGISAVLVALLLPVLFIFLGFVVFVGYSSLVRNELQSAADAAAHAGATILCSTRECYSGARDTAAWAISHHIAHSRFGSSADLNFPYNTTDAGPTWTASNLVVGIERGRWTPDNNFVSLEGWDDSTSANYQPGMVGYVTSNAIRVSIKRVRSAAGLGYFLGQEADIVASATAVNDTPQQVCAAPFAIPLCAVVNSNGNFDPEKINNNTRYFTGVERHCHGQSKYCNNLPSFPIEPTTESDVIREYYPIVPMPDMPTEFDNINKMHVFLDKRPGFNIDRYTSNPFDNYGVVGVPGSRGSSVTENEIRIDLETGGGQGCRPTHTGQTFLVLADGLKEQRTNDALWRRISGAIFGGPDEPATAHPEFRNTDLGERRELGTIRNAPDPKGWGIQHNSYLGDCRAQGIDSNDPTKPGNTWAFCDPTHPVQPSGDPTKDEGYLTHPLDTSWFVPVQNDIDGKFANNGGLCNSTRLLKSLEKFPAPADFDLNYSFYDAWSTWYSALSNVNVTGDVRTPGSGTPSMMEVITDLNMALTPIWQAEVPVIAARGNNASFCQGTAPGSTNSDPLPKEEEPVDPSLDWEIIGFVKVNFYDSDIGMDPPSLPSRYQDGTAFPSALPPGSHRFSFNQQCNVVRGKVAGRVKTLRSGPADEARKTLLVD